ncbi:hypothetical protein FJY70_05645 [candidate division WOR-3 bacterium]|nr:hypothetical protein [candidate division WOR-3 bacterium]
MAAARRAVVVRITDADQAFSLLLEKTRSLAESAQPHPLSTEVAVADVKRYAPDPLARVRLDDLFKAETRDVIRRVAELPSPQPTPKEWNKDFVRQQMELARSYSDRLLQMAAALAYHGSNDQAGLLVRSVEQLAGSRPIRERYQGIRLYPALLLAYSAGIAALAGERHKTLAALLLKPRIRPSSATREFSPLGEYVHSWGGSPGDTRFQELEYPLLSYRLKETLLALGGQYATVPEEYENLFWLFEFHFALALMETSGEIPVCLGVSNHDFALPDSQIRYTICPAISELVSLAESGNPDVPVLQAGFFGGDLQRLKDAVAKLKVRTQECRRHMM